MLPTTLIFQSHIFALNEISHRLHVVESTLETEHEKSLQILDALLHCVQNQDPRSPSDNLFPKEFLTAVHPQNPRNLDDKDTEKSSPEQPTDAFFPTNSLSNFRNDRQSDRQSDRAHDRIQSHTHGRSNMRTNSRTGGRTQVGVGPSSSASVGTAGGTVSSASRTTQYDSMGLPVSARSDRNRKSDKIGNGAEREPPGRMRFAASTARASSSNR